MPKKKAAAPRAYTCAITGLDIPYAGRGRPPKYHPDAMKDVAKKRNAEAYQKRKQKKRDIDAARVAA